MPYLDVFTPRRKRYAASPFDPRPEGPDEGMDTTPDVFGPRSAPVAYQGDAEPIPVAAPRVTGAVPVAPPEDVPLEPGPSLRKPLPQEALEKIYGRLGEMIGERPEIPLWRNVLSRIGGAFGGPAVRQEISGEAGRSRQMETLLGQAGVLEHGLAQQRAEEQARQASERMAAETEMFRQHGKVFGAEAAGFGQNQRQKQAATMYDELTKTWLSQAMTPEQFRPYAANLAAQHGLRDLVTDQQIESIIGLGRKSQGDLRQQYDEAVKRGDMPEARRILRSVRSLAEAGREPTTTPGVAGTGEQLLGQLDPQTASLVKGIANYELDPARVTSLRGGHRERIMGLVRMYDPTYDQTQYAARQAVRKDFTSGKAAANIRSLNTAIAHLDRFDRSGKALENSSVQLWNQIANYGITKVGHPQVTNFETDATAVASEMANVFKGMGATDQEINAWRQRVSQIMSPKQISGSIGELLVLMAGRMSALNNQYAVGLGKPRDFRLLSPASRAILARMGAHGQELIAADELSAPGAAPTAVTPENPYLPKKPKASPD